MRIATIACAALLVVIAAVTAACGRRADSRLPTAPSDPSRPASVQIQEVNFLVAESYPMQVTARVRGLLPDPCTAITDIRQERRQAVVTVTLGTRRSSDPCIQVVQPFEVNIRLNGGFVSGAYLLRINGADWPFTL